MVKPDWRLRTCPTGAGSFRAFPASLLWEALSAAHLPRTYISRIENGRILPGLGTLERVAGALHLNLPVLIPLHKHLITIMFSLDMMAAWGIIGWSVEKWILMVIPCPLADIVQIIPLSRAVQ